jgi:hypothetical protein
MRKYPDFFITGIIFDGEKEVNNPFFIDFLVLRFEVSFIGIAGEKTTRNDTDIQSSVVAARLKTLFGQQFAGTIQQDQGHCASANMI